MGASSRPPAPWVPPSPGHSLGLQGVSVVGKRHWREAAQLCYLQCCSVPAENLALCFHPDSSLPVFPGHKFPKYPLSGEAEGSADPDLFCRQWLLVTAPSEILYKQLLSEEITPRWLIFILFYFVAWLQEEIWSFLCWVCIQ